MVMHDLTLKSAHRVAQKNWTQKNYTFYDY